MIEIRETDEFSVWLGAFEGQARPGQNPRPHRTARKGQSWGCRAGGDGVSELRIDYGPGYRVYYVQRGTRYVLLLAGGDKGTQGRDIALAKRLVDEYEE
jgi:putative addiction module killer protein